jgi:hypothetical protein
MSLIFLGTLIGTGEKVHGTARGGGMCPHVYTVVRSPSTHPVHLNPLMEAAQFRASTVRTLARMQ